MLHKNNSGIAKLSSRISEILTGGAVRVPAVAAVVFVLGLGGARAQTAMPDEGQVMSAVSTPATDMSHMAGHMYMTKLRPLQPGDKEKAAAIVAAAKVAMAPYKDYRKALADGYTIFMPNLPQPQYHFSKRENAKEAVFHFDPSKPTSLLYKKTPDGGYKLVGAMYTDWVGATQDHLNQRIPLSIARWHQHINFCKAPNSDRDAYLDKNSKFGLRGSITTEAACKAAGGEFHPVIFGWMVHVYPYETSEKKIWATDDDHHGHDNMDHSAMQGMQMN